MWICPKGLNTGKVKEPEDHVYECWPSVSQPSWVMTINKFTIAGTAESGGEVMSEKIEIIKKALDRTYEKHNNRFMYTDSDVSEYYGRGGLEGLACGLWAIVLTMPDEEREQLKVELGPKMWSYLEVWGEQAWSDYDFTQDDDESEVSGDF